ncbi:MAG: hypothetical protein ACQEQE_05875 [Bacillota bacterium]
MSKKYKILKRDVNNFKRFIIDLVKTKNDVYSVLINLLIEKNEYVIMYDSKLSNVNDNLFIEEIKKYLYRNGIEYEVLKYKSDRKKNILSKIFSIGKENEEQDLHHKLCFVINQEKIEDIINIFKKYKSNIRIGINSTNKTIKKDYISNYINDKNRFEYYDIDLFLNYNLKRIAIFSKDLEKCKTYINRFKERYNG